MNPPGTYGMDWAVYRYDTTSDKYIDVGAAGVLEQGMGYWVIQNSGNAITLAMPKSSTPTESNHYRGGTTISLSTKTDGNQWNMIGYPYRTSQVLDDVSVEPCQFSSYCKLDPAESQGIVHNQLWSYTGSEYTKVNPSDPLKPWMGYWVATLSGANDLAPVSLVILEP